MAVAAVSMVMIGMVRPAVASRVVSHGVMLVAGATIAFVGVVFHAVMVTVRRVLAGMVIATGMISASMVVAEWPTTMLRTTTELRAEAVRAMRFGAGVEVAAAVRTESTMSAHTAVKLRSAGEALPRVEAEVLRAAGCAVAEAGATGEAVRSAMFEHTAELMPAVVLRRRLLGIAAWAARSGIPSGFVRRVFLVVRRWAASLFQSLLEPLQSIAQLLIFGFEFLNTFFGVAGCGLRRRRELRSSDERES